VILCLFFTLAGMHLALAHAGVVGLAVLGFVGARAAGKLAAAGLAMRLAGATESLQRRLGPALLPQAGLSVGLLLLIQDDPAFHGIAPFFTAAVLSAVTVNELVGPLAVRMALSRAGEVGRDRPRLIDFLQEEHITADLEADSMEAAIGQLVDQLIRSHGLRGVDRDALLRSVLEREKQVSTCLGEGLAVPHGELPEGQAMVGVMGLSRRGLPFDTPDGRPVHCVVLLATPAGERDRHLQVLAALARTVGANPAVRQQLYTAKSAAHAYEILYGKAAEGFDALLEER
jgi:PTS system fructose-specific IIC component